jgi:hypothetical protein
MACGPAFADRLVEPRHQKVVEVIEPVVEKAPYTLEITDKKGRELTTHEHNGKFYVEGSVGQRYIIRVTNPTDRRVEAVLSVDGLDVIDGENADFASKRGYVVPARGELRIEGFRVSTSEVATFRFSSVSDSYADRKGKPRNIGVIGLAIFEEKQQPQIILSQEKPYTTRKYDRRDLDDDYEYDYYEDSAPGADGGEASGRTEAEPADAPRGGYGNTGTATRGHARRSASKAPPPAKDSNHVGGSKISERCCTEVRKKKKSRPGLGTEFGERRSSAVQWTKFERNDPTTPDAFAELRYNDVDGLRAMGLVIDNPHTSDEVTTRETANPFPGFAQPPSM